MHVFHHGGNVRSHNGSVFEMGKGSIINRNRKQNKMARSSTEGKLNGADKMFPCVAWENKFIECQHST